MVLSAAGVCLAMLRMMAPLRATIEEFAAEGFTHIECHCPRFRMTRLRPISWLPRISMGLSIAQGIVRVNWLEPPGEDP